MTILPSLIKRITFRKEASDRATIGHPGTTIKVNGKESGMIVENPGWAGNPNGDNLFRIRFQVGVTAAEGQNCAWSWITVKQTFETELAAREWLTVDRLRVLIASLAGKPHGKLGSTYTGTVWIDDSP